MFHDTLQTIMRQSVLLSRLAEHPFLSPSTHRNGFRAYLSHLQLGSPVISGDEFPSLVKINCVTKMLRWGPHLTAVRTEPLEHAKSWASYSDASKRELAKY